MKLIVTSNTIFKQAALPASDLSSNDKIDVKAGTEYEITAYLEIGAQPYGHVKFTLKDQFLAGKNTWIAYQQNVEIRNDDGLKVIGKYQVGDKLPEKVDLPVVWFSQLDNKFEPHRTCNVTCVAMCLYYFGIRPKNSNERLPDELFQFVESKGWDRYAHDDLPQLFIEYGVSDEFKMSATWDEVKTHLANNNPVILPGLFTASGHIIVLRGYDDTGFLVNDPNGEFFYSGYREDLTGENLHYSYQLVQSKSMNGPDATWAHFPKNSNYS